MVKLYADENFELPIALGKSTSEVEAELAEMANDPDMLRELAAIELEFAATSMDGLTE